MAYQIIDRRPNQKGKSLGNRRRFIKRVRNQIRKAVRKNIREGNITDITSDEGKSITIPKRDLQEPNIVHGDGGEHEYILPGNDQFSTGDRVDRPPKQGGGSGSEGSKDGEGDDEFTFQLSKEEFLDLFFEDLELPDLVKKNLKATSVFESRRAGFVKEGNPARLNIERSMRKAKGRRTALRGPKKRQLRELEEELANVIADIEAREQSGQDTVLERQRKERLEEEIKVLRRKIRAIPYVDEMDLQYNHWTKLPVPTTKAVMFCIMDVSGSMGEWEKEMAKRFFMLLYLFLTRSYDTVDLVFIRHHSMAKECDEDEFFYSKETGGTIVSTALEMMQDIIKERYDLNTWNIYACQASDGDNWTTDNAVVRDLLENYLLNVVQYYAYVEIKDQKYRGNRDSDLWDMYDDIRSTHSNFDITQITDVTEIYPVFRKLFEKDKATV